MLLVPRPPRAATDADAAVDPQLLARVLTPYKPHCRYLRTAAVRYATARSIAAASGTFSIPESCYIASTGHFNAVEFNICYNQLTYCFSPSASKIASSRSSTVGPSQSSAAASYRIT